jgi:hypothetical protein
MGSAHHVADVLTEHQRGVMARVLAEEEARREHIVVYLSRAHAYGFPSPDSDLDLKAIHVVRTADLVGLTSPAPTVDRAEVVDGVEIDYTSMSSGTRSRAYSPATATSSSAYSEPDLTRLMDRYGVADAAELVERKRAGERVGLDPALVEAWRPRVRRGGVEGRPRARLPPQPGRRGRHLHRPMCGGRVWRRLRAGRPRADRDATRRMPRHGRDPRGHRLLLLPLRVLRGRQRCSGGTLLITMRSAPVNLLIVVELTLACVGCRAEQGGSERAFRRFRGDGFEGIVVVASSKLVPPTYGYREEGYFTPEDEQIGWFEAGLATHLRASPPPRSPKLYAKYAPYHRRYVGMRINGAKKLYTSFYCPRFDGWERPDVAVEDGGDCFFHVVYDVTRGSYELVSVNGEA